MIIVKQNKQGDKEMVTKMRRQAYKSKDHETFLAKHAYTSKGPNPGIEMVIKAIRKKNKALTYHVKLNGLAMV